MPNFDEAIRATEEMFEQKKQAQKEEQAREEAKKLLENLLALERAKQQAERITISKVEKQENLVKQIVWNSLKKIRIKKIHVLVAVYIALVVTELFFCVPYHNIQIFRSQQNVPHTEIIGSGYATMANVTKDKAYVDTEKPIWTPSEIGKIVNTSQLFMNVSITTILAIGLYFLLQRKEKNTIEDDVPMPMLDIDSLAFADAETQKAELDKYALKMAEYIKRKKC